jgi:uncharacterized phage infection (PIP) family protein YhgE
VRNLAQRSAQAARETADKIEDSIKKSDHGVQISANVSNSLQEIVTKAQQVDELLGEIATASKEQSQGIEQVNTAVVQMDKVTQSSAAGAEESASAAEELNAQAKSLKDNVGQLLALVEGGATKAAAVRNFNSGGGAASLAPGKTLMRPRHSNGYSKRKVVPAQEPSVAAAQTPMADGWEAV